MKILAVTCYTGDHDLCKMTEDMLMQLCSCVPESVELRTSVFGQGSDRMVEADCSTGNPENVGFAFGMNQAISAGQPFEPDYVLCLNNDLKFPIKDWLAQLVKEAKPDRICVPATDKAAIRIQAGPLPMGPLFVHEMSAYCWLVPFAWCQWLKKNHGFWLFDEEFAPCYGEDNWTAFLLSQAFGRNIFCYVRRSWVKHLRKRTSSQVKHDRRKTSALLVDRLKGALKNGKLRLDLKAWANRYIAILSKRC